MLNHVYAFRVITRIEMSVEIEFVALTGDSIAIDPSQFSFFSRRDELEAKNTHLEHDQKTVPLGSNQRSGSSSSSNRFVCLYKIIKQHTTVSRLTQHSIVVTRKLYETLSAVLL